MIKREKANGVGGKVSATLEDLDFTFFQLVCALSLSYR